MRDRQPMSSSSTCVTLDRRARPRRGASTLTSRPAHSSTSWRAATLGSSTRVWLVCSPDHAHAGLITELASLLHNAAIITGRTPYDAMCILQRAIHLILTPSTGYLCMGMPLVIFYACFYSNEDY